MAKKKSKAKAKAKHWTEYLRALGACSGVERYQKFKTVQAAWAKCSDLQDMHWLVEKLMGIDESDAACRSLVAECSVCSYPFTPFMTNSMGDGHARIFQGREYTDRQWIAFVKTAFPVPDLWALEEAVAGRKPWVKA